MITIIDYGVGNLTSVQNMLKKCGVQSRVSSEAEVIVSSEKLILPGVGAFDYAMEKIEKLGLRNVLKQAAEDGSKILGICLGAQLLMDKSEEGVLPGLSLISGSCKKFKPEDIAPLRIPHMGWNDVFFLNEAHPLAKLQSSTSRFYFTHSFHLDCLYPEQRLAVSTYGIEFTSAVANQNVMGVQFHPEKSHAFGFSLLTNFANM